MPADDPLQAALRVAGALDRLGVPYFVTGSLASSFVGVPRSTQDVDLVAQLRAEDVDRLVAEIQSEFYVDEEMIRSAIRRVGSFNVVHLPTAFKVDVFVGAKDRFSTQQMARRVQVTLPDPPGGKLAMASAEDVILSKLHWFAEGGGMADQQWRDVLDVFLVQGARLDTTYLDEWSRHLGLEDLLRRARSQVTRDGEGARSSDS